MYTTEQLDRLKILKKSQINSPVQYLDWGFPVLNEALKGFNHGVFLIAGPPNFGKSVTALNIYLKLLENNDDILVIDFTLDDTFEDRVTNTIASLAKVPINWVKLQSAQEVSDIAKTEIDNQYRNYYSNYFNKLDIKDETDFNDRGKYFSNISGYVREVKANNPDKKIVVVVDGFHNVYVDTAKFSDENAKQAYLSDEMKTLATSTDSIIIATAHTPKKSMKRGLTQDAVKGSGGATYDAKVIATIFSDYKANRGNASIMFQADLAHEPGVTRTMPVIELDIVKNKTSSFCDIIFYRFFTEYAYIEECDDIYQTNYKNIVYGKS